MVAILATTIINAIVVVNNNGVVIRHGLPEQISALDIAWQADVTVIIPTPVQRPFASKHSWCGEPHD